MAENIMRDHKIWFDGRDLTGAMNSLALEYGADMVEVTAFGDTARNRLGGLKSVTASLDGFYDPDPVDADLFAAIASSDKPFSVAVPPAAEGDVAYTVLAVSGEYSPGAPVGDAFGFSFGMESNSPLVRGTLMHNATRTTSADGTARQLGAVADGQSLFAALHVLTAGGTAPTLDVTIESDDAMGFASPATRITFDQATAIGGQWKSLAGPLTDDWFRVAWSVGGTAPSFQFVVVLGIQ